MSSNYPPPPSSSNAIGLGIDIAADQDTTQQPAQSEQPHQQLEDHFHQPQEDQHAHSHQQVQDLQEHHHQQLPPHGLPHYDPGLDDHGIPDAHSQMDPIAAAAAAHHGLQALQAAVAAPPVSPGPPQLQSPITPQYANHSDPMYHIAPNGPVALPSPGAKVTRLRRACDMCSQRKVKCDEKHPCRPCRDLNVDCTFNREMKRRGPPNKHAEAAKAAKRPRLEPNISPGPHHAAETLISIAGTPGVPGVQGAQNILDAESIVPLSILDLLVDDFFTYIHPLTPFPHEPTFRQSFANREDRTSREFLALVAGMIGCLVASFPRTARLHLKAQQHSIMYPRSIDLIDRCRAVALEARGPLFYNKDEITVYDAATSYFIGLAAAYTMQLKICRRFMNEAMSFVRELGYHKPRDLGSMFSVTYRGPAFDHVEDQMGKRIFWVLFLGIRSMVQLGSPHGETVLPPPTPSEPYPELPVEVDDRYILPQQILGQPQGVVSKLTGFNQVIKIYMTMNPIVSVELSYGMSTLPFHDQKTMLDENLKAVKDIMLGLPPELTLNLDPTAGLAESTFELGDLNSGIQKPEGFIDDGFQYYPNTFSHQPVTDFRHVMEQQPERRRPLQYEIQKANIYCSQLATRSYYVERYLNLRDAHREHTRAQAAEALGQAGEANGAGAGEDSKTVAAAAIQAVAADPIDSAMSAERELIVQNLLTVLASISQRNLEPNGHSLVNKIRQVASTVYDSAPERRGPLAVKAQEPLHQFLDIMMRLERTSAGLITVPDNGLNNQEEEELRQWAELRDHQMRFFQSGGYLSQP